MARFLDIASVVCLKEMGTGDFALLNADDTALVGLRICKPLVCWPGLSQGTWPTQDKVLQVQKIRVPTGQVVDCFDPEPVVYQVQVGFVATRGELDLNMRKCLVRKLPSHTQQLFRSAFQDPASSGIAFIGPNGHDIAADEVARVQGSLPVRKGFWVGKAPPKSIRRKSHGPTSVPESCYEHSNGHPEQEQSTHPDEVVNAHESDAESQHDGCEVRHERAGQHLAEAQRCTRCVDEFEGSRQRGCGAGGPCRSGRALACSF